VLDKSLLEHKIKSLKICVIIPTYNNERTLKRVIDGVLEITDDLIVINDGATDSTSRILKKYTDITQIYLPKNKGKGNALRVGFKKAEELGYEFSITIDSDGQHYPEDIAVFVNQLEFETNKNILLIGSRNMNQEAVPGGSSFGNKFSNFWYKVETSIQLKDTQSGFRLYPLKELNKIKFYTSKFEFEIENIVKAAWKGIIVKNVPVKVLYDEQERVSHFRPFKDFARISLLNTWLVLVAFIYIKPRDLIRKLRKKGIRRFIKEEILGSNESPLKSAQAMALGVFIGLTPLWGLHTILVLSLAILFKLNKVISFAFTNVSFPPFIPFTVYASIMIGTQVLGEPTDYSFADFEQNFEFVKSLKTYVVGSFILAFVASIIVGLVSYFLLSLYNKKKHD
jgi:glycosyltransferase involved in cell wall biosynthesis|tara:strand:+ start:2596 stop:3783 length:1188 start_codon:yes stop_codon:yes gene_type:complete